MAGHPFTSVGMEVRHPLIILVALEPQAPTAATPPRCRRPIVREATRRLMLRQARAARLPEEQAASAASVAARVEMLPRREARGVRVAAVETLA